VEKKTREETGRCAARWREKLGGGFAGKDWRIAAGGGGGVEKLEERADGDVDAANIS
jgi:hypothetical protein